ncbi:ATPase-coupled protein transmembrane transporter [Aureococcus anophagefferens]|nr:ATPase-coupled protein transmembrane transporter [Aureococcus anophagefferens]
MMQVLALLATASALVAPPALPGSRARRAHTPVRMLELPTFPTFDLDSIFKSDPATMSREPGWLKKARELVGGMALHEGKLAEMATGEGKTLVATLPLYLRSLDGKGCHVITVNDYLARRDAETLQPLFDFLGLTVGVVQSESTSEQRQAAYAADVTYVTNNELGFDYLRDHLAYETPELTVTQRPLHFAIVDEADSILVDEARTPLIISGEGDGEAPAKYEAATLAVNYLERGRDYERRGRPGLWAETKWAAYVFPALNAKELYFKERDYIVDKGELKIVDEFTGRVPTAKPLRREDGGDLVFKSKLDKFRYVLRDVKRRHASGQPVLCGTTSIEDATLVSQLLANEGVPHRVLNANPKLARKESEIVSQAGRRGAVTIATNMAGRGTDILLGGNAALTAQLKLREALAPAVDGRLGPLVAVEPGLYPVADLGDAVDGALEAAAAPPRASSGAIFGDAANGTEVAAGAALDRIDDVPRVTAPVAGRVGGRRAERAEVRALGGLAVLGTERHESVRIDNQLRGRSGRQGDAGASCYAISLEDKMFNVFGADKMQQLAFAFDIAGDDGEPLQSDLLSKSLATIQEKVETYYREMRTNLVRYDKIVDVQRRVFYNRRQQVLTADRPTVEALMGQYVADTAADTVANATLGLGADGDFGSAYAAAGDVLRRMYPRRRRPSTPPPRVAAVEKKGVGEDDLPAMLMRFYVMREFDAAWQQHLRDLEFLRENVGFQSYSQKDPFQEWTIQSNELFTKLSAKVYRNAAIAFLSLDVDGLVPRPDLAPPTPVVPTEDEAAAAAAADAFASTAAAPCETEKPFWIVARQSGSVQRDLPIFATKAGAVSLRAEGPGRVTRRDFAEGIFVLDSVLRDDECDEIIEMSEAMGYASDAPASLRPCRAATVEAVRRNANVTWIVDDALNDAVFARAKRLLPPTIDLQTRDGVDFSLGPVAGLNRRWRLYRYGENDVFGWHKDGGWPGSGLDTDARSSRTSTTAGATRGCRS